MKPLTGGRDYLDGMHANTQIPKIIGFQRVYEANGDDAYHNAAAFFWRTVAHTRAFATVVTAIGEHFFAMAISTNTSSRQRIGDLLPTQYA